MNINFKTRGELKNFFKKNAIPTAGNFADFIDAGVSQKDDGLLKPAGEPLSLEASIAATKPAIRFYESFVGNTNPTWVVSLIEPVSHQSAFVLSDALGNTRLWIGQNGVVTAPGALSVGSLTTTGATAAAGLTTSGLLSANAGINVTGAPLNVGTSAGTAQPLTVWGPLTANSTATVNGLLTANGGVTTSGTVSTGALTVSGNVGLGTATPGAKLDVKGGAILDRGANAQIFTGIGGGELNRYLELLNSPGFGTASGLKAGGVLVADAYAFANPGKSDLVVKGKVAIATPTAGSALHVNGGATVGPFAPFDVVGSLNVTGASAELGFVRRNLGSWPVTPAAGDRFIWYNPDGVARLWTHVNGDLMTVKANGNVGLGTSDPQFRLQVMGRLKFFPDASSAGHWLVGQGTSTSAGVDASFVGLMNDVNVGFYGATGTAGWRLWVNTTTGALAISSAIALKPGGGAWGASSDVRLKQNIGPLDHALERLLQLRGATYEWKQPEKQGNHTGPQVGFIGQEVETVFPEWITDDAEGYKVLSIRGFEALAVEALRELRAENQALKQSHQKLQAQIATLAGHAQVKGEAS
jgi:hypothetical protein